MKQPRPSEHPSLLFNVRPWLLRSLLVGCIFLLLVVASSCREEEISQSKPTAWAELDGKPVSPEDIRRETLLSFGDLTGSDGDTLSPAWLQQTVKEHLERKLLAAEAQARNIILLEPELDAEITHLLESLPEDRRESVSQNQPTMDLFRQITRENMLASLLFKKDLFLRITVSDEELRKEYEQDPSAWVLPEKYSLQQIVCKTEEEAKEARKLVRKGEDFSTVAKELSIAPEKDRGGHLGWVQADELPDPFGDWLKQLRVGRVSKVFESAYGYHILLLSEKSKEKSLSFEDAKDQLTSKVFEQKKRGVRQETLDRLWKQHRVRIYEENIH